MKYFFVFLFFLAIKIQDGLTQDNNIPGFLASVREYPFHLHKCTATLISTKHLIAPAACIFCVYSCRQQVAFYSSFAFPQDIKSFEVVKTTVHPHYATSMRDHNIGVIEIENEYRDPMLFNILSRPTDLSGISGTIFKWNFNPEMTEFKLNSIDVEVIENSVCSIVLKKYIPSTFICVKNDNQITLGQFDQGSPFIGEVRNERYVLAIYNEDLLVNNQTFVPYQLVQPFYKWINDIISGQKKKQKVLPVVSKLPLSDQS